jgi:hypothetical protein
MSEDLRNSLLKDTEWWIEKMSHWKDGRGSSCDLPILSASEILEHPDKIMVVQSDA